MNSDTIYALGSGAGRAAIGVFRISGPDAKRLITASAGSLPPPRVAKLVRFKDPVSKDILDQGLILWFPGPSSFTGEDMAEFHIHGSAAVAAAFVRVFAEIGGVRPAEPGEFSRRAFLNGKLDLSAVEGLADLIEAETEAQRRQAICQASGQLRIRALGWRASLVEAAALIEGEIDFSDEADVPKEIAGRVAIVLGPVLAGLGKELGSRSGERIRDGLTIVIAGPPNAGKSTLLNALARRDVAIVSEHAGTTRDLLEVHLDIDGLPVTLIDTAGLRDSGDPIEQIGVARARKRSQEADLVLWLSDAGVPVAPDPALSGGDIWAIETKADLIQKGLGYSPLPAEAAGKPRQGKELRISARTGEGLDELIGRLGDFAKAATYGEGGLITRERHRRAFQSAASALARIVDEPARPIEFLAEDLRLATRALESLVGGVDVEDVLGEIFSRFCVGK